MMYRKWLIELTFFVHLLCSSRFHMMKALEAAAEYMEYNFVRVNELENEVVELTKRVATLELMCIFLSDMKKDKDVF